MADRVGSSAVTKGVPATSACGGCGLVVGCAGAKWALFLPPRSDTEPGWLTRETTRAAAALCVPSRCRYGVRTLVASIRSLKPANLALLERPLHFAGEASATQRGLCTVAGLVWVQALAREVRVERELALAGAVLAGAGGGEVDSDDGDTDDDAEARVAATGEGGLTPDVASSPWDSFLQAKAGGLVAAEVTYHEYITHVRYCAGAKAAAGGTEPCEPAVAVDQVTLTAQSKRKGRGKLPVYLHGRGAARWPITDEYARVTLMKHKRHVLTAADIQGDAVDMTSAFVAWVDAGLAPPFVRHALMAAHSRHTHRRCAKRNAKIYALEEGAVVASVAAEVAATKAASCGAGLTGVAWEAVADDSARCARAAVTAATAVTVAVAAAGWTCAGRRWACTVAVAEAVATAAALVVACARLGVARDVLAACRGGGPAAEAAAKVAQAKGRVEEARGCAGRAALAGDAEVGAGAADGGGYTASHVVAKAWAASAREEARGGDSLAAPPDPTATARAQAQTRYQRRRRERAVKKGGKKAPDFDNPRRTAGHGVDPAEAEDPVDGLGVDPSALPSTAHGGVDRTDYAPEGHRFPDNPAMPALVQMERHWDSLRPRSRARRATDTRVPDAPSKARARGFKLISPLMTAGNTRQLQYTASLLQYFKTLAAYSDAHPGHEPYEGPDFHATLLGKAGTGKSLVSQLTLVLSRLYWGADDAAVVVGPTGAAANVVGGSTLDSEWDINRVADDLEGPAPKFGAPRDIARRLGENAGRRAVVIDELSMHGQKMFGMEATRCGQLMNRGVQTAKQSLGLVWGGVKVLLLVGDFMQLVPVNDDTLAGGLLRPTSTLRRDGAGAYAAIGRHFVLDHVMRSDDPVFTSRLEALRTDARQTQEAQDYWDARSVKSVNFEGDPADFTDITNNECVYIACRHKGAGAQGVEEMNDRYVQELEKVCTVRSSVRGVRHQSKTKQMGKFALGSLHSVPRTSRVALGMRVRLTTNIATSFGLFNNACGTVKEIVYADGVRASEVLTPARLWTPTDATAVFSLPAAFACGVRAGTDRRY